jgi:DNA invertase Pin-like site-specific DNA recombinase
MPSCPHCGQDLTPHEIGVLYAAVGRKQKRPSRRWGVKLTPQEVSRIRRSKRPIKALAGKYNVSFHTIWRAKVHQTYTGPTKLDCPHCEHKLTPKEIARLFGSLGGSTWRPRKTAAPRPPRPKRAKLTENDVVEIRKSKASLKELMKEYKVSRTTISEINRFVRWKGIPSGKRQAAPADNE